MSAMFKNLENDLRVQIHEVRDEWHNTCHVKPCLGPIMDNYIEKVIDLTEKMDETKEELDEPIEIEY